MAGKEAIALILDVGKSMHGESSQNEGVKKLDVALDFLKGYLTKKVLFEKQHETSLILMGSDEADDGDFTQMADVAKVDVTRIEMLEEIRNSKKSSIMGGDIFRAISHALDDLHNYVKAKKYDKRIFVFTDGNGTTKHDERRVRDLAKKAKTLNTKVNIIAIDFCEEDDEDEGGSRNQQTAAQNKNQELLEIFCEAAEAKIFPSSLAIHIQKQFKTRFVRATAKYKGSLQITPELKIRVVSYGKVVEEKFPTAKKYSLVAGKDKSLTQGKIVYKRESYLHDDPDQNEINPDNRIKGYYYGKQLVPIPGILTDKLKYTAPKCMKILCFADKKSVPRHYYMHSVDMMIAQDDQNDKKALASLIHALYELDKIAIARYVYRENYAPKLVCLTPHIGSEYECLWINVLPTVEDIRDYQFTSLKDSTTEQQKVMGDFIDSLDLMKCEEDDEEKEGLKCSNTFNPTIHYLYQCLTHRAFNEDDKLPALDPSIGNYVRPDKKMFDKAKLAIENMDKVFSFKENPKKDKAQGKKFWSEMISSEARKMEEEAETQEEQAAVVGKAEKAFDVDKDIVRQISQANPVTDFRKMVNEKAEDLTESAIEQMTKLIEKFIGESFQGSLYDKALECLQELRKGCVQEDEAPSFNDFLELIKDRYCSGKHQKFWQKVINHGVTLIDSSESSSSTLSEEDARKFLLEQDKHVQQKAEEEQQDLMADIE